MVLSQFLSSEGTELDGKLKFEHCFEDFTFISIVVPKFPRKEPTIKDISPNIVQLSWQPAMLPTGFDDITYRVEIQSPPGISTWNTLYANHPTPSVRLADLRPDLDYLVRVRAVGKDFVSEPTMPVYIPRRAGK